MMLMIHYLMHLVVTHQVSHHKFQQARQVEMWVKASKESLQAIRSRVNCMR